MRTSTAPVLGSREAAARRVSTGNGRTHSVLESSVDRTSRNAERSIVGVAGFFGFGVVTILPGVIGIDVLRICSVTTSVVFLDSVLPLLLLTLAQVPR